MKILFSFIYTHARAIPAHQVDVYLNPKPNSLLPYALAAGSSTGFIPFDKLLNTLTCSSL